jgi:hypothetical protein
MKPPTPETDAAIAEVVRAFILKNGITCPETINQCDWVILNAYDFIEKLCDAAGYVEREEENEL